MDLLINASESIQVGVADYQVGSRPRLLSAVRNIHAGILLLFKEALRRRSPPGSNEVLVKARSQPQADAGGQTIFVGVGKKTATVRDIQERFEGLGIVTDWKRFERITNLRNDIEHYFPALAKNAVADVVASAFVIVRTFCLDELKEDPMALLGSETWKAMLLVSEVYDAERAACNAGLAAVTWGTTTLEEGAALLRCSQCGSDLLAPSGQMAGVEDLVMKCRACGHGAAAEEFVQEAVAEALGAESFAAAQDGAEPPFGECPQCGLQTYVLEESRCAYCGESAVTKCSRCGTTIPACEMGSSPLCGYCDHAMSKDD